jgi:hypothetical protein
MHNGKVPDQEAAAGYKLFGLGKYVGKSALDQEEGKRLRERRERSSQGSRGKKESSP